jgi:hypothetical protein
MDIPPEEVVNEQIAHLEQMIIRLRDINSYRPVYPPFRSPNYVKHEEETRMHEVMSNSSKYYNEGYHTGIHPMYHESISPNDQYWINNEGGRSKYKKRSVYEPLSNFTNCSELPHLDGATVVISSRLQNGDVVRMVLEHYAMLVVYVFRYSK